MPDTVFCVECKWFVRNNKVASVIEKSSADFLGTEYKTDGATGLKIPNESFWDCSHQFNIGKKIEWWGLLRYYKKKASFINAKNDCVRFERRRDGD